MNQNLIVAQIFNMNYNWFKNQEVRFKNESHYNEDRKKIYNITPHNEYDGKGKVIGTFEEIIDIDFLEYCFDSYFNWSAKQLFLLTNDIDYWYDDGIDFVNAIIRIIKIDIAKFTDVQVIDAYIKEVNNLVLTTIINLKESNSETNYIQYLDDFVLEKNAIFAIEFEHITTQFEIKLKLQKSNSTIDRILTYAICQKIAEFKIKNKRLVTSVVPAEQDNAQVLLFLLTNTGEVQPKTRFLIEDWAVQDFYYLLILILESFSNISSVSQIEKNKGFQLKTEKFFASNSFYKFKSDNRSAYIDRNESRLLVDDLMYPFLKR